MADVEKIYHNLKSRAVGLKSAAELLPNCAPEKRGKVIALMRDAAKEIERLLTELETGPRP